VRAANAEWVPGVPGCARPCGGAAMRRVRHRANREPSNIPRCVDRNLSTRPRKRPSRPLYRRIPCYDGRTAVHLAANGWRLSLGFGADSVPHMCDLPASRGASCVPVLRRRRPPLHPVVHEKPRGRGQAVDERVTNPEWDRLRIAHSPCARCPGDDEAANNQCGKPRQCREYECRHSANLRRCLTRQGCPDSNWPQPENGHLAVDGNQEDGRTVLVRPG
jgi:hypothetical protein